MKLQEQDGQPNGLADIRFNPLLYVLDFLNKTFVITEIEIRKLRHDPTELITRVIQPVIWLLIFGEVLAHAHTIPTGNISYIAFMAPGILAQSVLFVSIFYGIAVIWERDLGIVYKFLASPISRTAIVLGKAVAAGIRSFSQALIIYILAILLGVKVNLNILSIIEMLLFILLGAIFFSTFSLIVACIVKVRERFMGIGQLLTMPLFFASNAIYPISLMPRWLQVSSHLNPLTYEVDAIRALMISGTTSMYGIGTDMLILILATTILVGLGGKIYPNIAI